MTDTSIAFRSHHVLPSPIPQNTTSLTHDRFSTYTSPMALEPTTAAIRLLHRNHSALRGTKTDPRRLARFVALQARMTRIVDCSLEHDGFVYPSSYMQNFAIADLDPSLANPLIYFLNLRHDDRIFLPLRESHQNFQTGAVYFNDEPVDHYVDNHDAQHIYDALITWPSLYGYDEEDDISSDSRDASPCEEDNVTGLRTPSSEYESDEEDTEELDPRNRRVDSEGNVEGVQQHHNILTPLVPLLNYRGRCKTTSEPFTDTNEPDDFNVRPTIRVPTDAEEALHDADMSHLFDDREGFHQAFQDFIDAVRQLRESAGTTENDMEYSEET